MEEQVERIDVTLSRSTRVSDEGMRVYASVIKDKVTSDSCVYGLYCSGVNLDYSSAD